MGWIHNANATVARSVVGRWFRLEGSGHVSARDLIYRYRPGIDNFLSPRKGKVLTSSPSSVPASPRSLLWCVHRKPISVILCTFPDLMLQAYIISVNSTIVSDSGGTCVCPADSPDLCDSDTAYMLCVQDVRRDLVTATAAISALTSFCMGLFANLVG